MAGQTINSNNITTLGSGSPDGTNVEPSATRSDGSLHRFAVFGTPSPYRQNPSQAMVQGLHIGDVASYNANAGALANAVTITCNEVTITATGVLATDMVVGVSKPTAQAGMGIAGIRITANDTIGINLCNPTAANVVPTANQTYAVACVRNLNYVTANLGVIGAVNLNSTKEVEFTVAGANAAATCSINSAGQVVNANVTAQGTGYYTVPTVVITPAANDPGCGATAKAYISGTGQVTGVKITNGGTGYATAPTISFIGGNTIVPGMIAQVNKAAQQAGLGIGNVRVSGNNKVAITYFNDTAANITVTANQNYVIGAWNEMAAISPIISVVANCANLTAAAANASNTTTVATPGIAAADAFLSTSVALQSPLVFAGGVCTANNIVFQYGAGVPGATPANGVYNFQVWQRKPVVPLRLFAVNLTPTAVANNTTAEQIFSLPSNATLLADSCVVVNKPSHTSGIGIVGARANSATEVAITYINVTAANITPPAETYLIASFPIPVPTLVANVVESHSIVSAGMSFNQLVDMSNEIQQYLQVSGQIQGA